ncbi:hypothetical protein MLD38_028719 [Melastoma candidum]|uniref:Uncharacterized protein n=1 Tax=Melastoma candidum TaxID=119954 RepID=A0ACB9N424_9MYRT|nr:hypothetical protein MLD38_028719 [Melastoma candidum]
MDTSKVLHMNGGLGNNSYARNSSIQKNVISMTKLMIEEAVMNLCSQTTHATLVVADLGCSSGPNTLYTVTEIVRAVENLCKVTGHRPPEYQVFLNDLPGNDFNTLFRMLPDFQEKYPKSEERPRCFFSGVPGSFYGRLFPCNSLHFVHSACSLHWLSKVPKHIENNERNICTARTSPPNVLEAYHEQFHEDFTMFLDCRAAEIVSGGSMVLTIAGRRSNDQYSNGCCYVWELLAMALQEMVSEGLIEEKKLFDFNVPGYTPTLEEVKSKIENQGSFSISNLVVLEVNWGAYDSKINSGVSSEGEGGINVVKCVRAAVEQILLHHFGDGIVEGCFDRYKKLFVDRVSKEEKVFTDVCVSLIRK